MHGVDGMEGVDFEPPPCPPRFLNLDQVSFLSHQGWLPLDLPEGIHSSLQRVSTEAASFFTEEKEAKAALYPKAHGTECGYYVVPEEKEYVTFRRRLHPELPLEQEVYNAWKQAANLLHRVLCDLGSFNYCHPDTWDQFMVGAFGISENETEMFDNNTLMRLFKYYPDGIAEQHVDIGLLTLCLGDSSGFEVWDQETKEWVATEKPIILVGQTVSVLLSGQARAGRHRVVSNPRGRNSLVFALRPYLKADVDLRMFGGEGMMNVREFFDKIRGARYNINATKDIREKQRQERERVKQQKQAEETQSVSCESQASNP